MAAWEEARWEAGDVTDRPRRDRRSGPYRTYLPDPLAEAPLALDAETDALVAEAERRVRAVVHGARDLAGIARFLLRSEAIASSRIEGIAPSARQVALAELGQSESVRGISAQAQLVANNMTVVREAATQLVELAAVSISDVVHLQQSLLPDEPRHHGVRTVQNWIGGSDWHPIDAEFVPPAPDRLPALMEDLMAYLAGAVHSPIVQAALVHAQFETIHPFTDGNGRVGRALIHTVLARRGLAHETVLPVSLVLSTLRERYVDGLTGYRYEAEAGSAAANGARAAWVRIFAEVTLLASDEASQITDELIEMRESWRERLNAYRSGQGARRALRSDSATASIIADLPATPVLTTRTVMRIHRVSRVAAQRALDELAGAGILHSRSISPGERAYLADDVLDTIAWAERRLASTRFDTRQSPPLPGSPAAPRR